MIENRYRQGHAIGLKLLDPIRYDETSPLMKGLCPRKERGRMSVRSHPEEHKIEAGKLSGLQPEKVTQRLLVLNRCLMGIRVLRLEWDGYFPAGRELSTAGSPSP